MSGRRLGLVAVIAAALAALLTSATWALSGVVGPVDGMMRGTMMGSRGWVDGSGPVTDLEQARTAAQRYADRLDLRVGEVMEFDDGFYAELTTPGDRGATEVLVDRDDGDVRLEHGPATMWNTEYGMHRAGSTRPAAVSAEQAQQLADEWLREHREGLSAGEVDTFPGYYTLHTLRSGKIDGMLSVNASTGAVWYHSWHGEFVDMSEE